MQTDKAVSDLFQYLPHRPPMVWVDQVLEVGKNDQGIYGRCRVNFKEDSLYLNARGELRGSAAIEFTAQAYGYVRALYHVLNNIDDTPSRTYLTGVRSCTANFKGLSKKNTNELMVHIQLIRELHPLVYVRGQIFVKNIPEPIAETEVQVYAE